VFELFRTKVLTEDQTIEIILGNVASYKGKPRDDGDVDMNDPVRALGAHQAIQHLAI
jgi:hypothetical protein